MTILRRTKKTTSLYGQENYLFFGSKISFNHHFQSKIIKNDMFFLKIIVFIKLNG